jgi:hypothetical protein
MANGSIVNIDATTHPDLAVAMRGGGSQFGKLLMFRGHYYSDKQKGIVTQFKALAHPIGSVWGGYKIYDPTQATAIFAGLHAFAATGSQDPKAAIIETNLVLVGGITSHLLYYFYDGPTPPTQGPFADLLAIPALISTVSTQSYSSLVSWVTHIMYGGFLTQYSS